MSLPKVAVVGSCVSRDVLNRSFIPHYKLEAEAIDTIYQSSLPSLVRESDVDYVLPETVRPNFVGVMKKEFLGNKLAQIAVSRPDVLLVDFFADVHLGITTVNDEPVTRNHMAFQTSEDADNFYCDHASSAPERMRFETNAPSDAYQEVALNAIITFNNLWRQESPDTLIVLNSARFSTTYVNQIGEIFTFDNSERLMKKNDSWSELDALFEEVTKCKRIVHDPSRFIGSVEHPWGLHPVHYSQPYYSDLWRSLADVIKNKKKL